jgi:hypothetical protein
MMARMLWRPRFFAALGAGFQADPTLRDGVHLRWTLDPRLGLPRAPDHRGFEIAFLRTKEGSIARVDLFQTTQPYPVHSSLGGLGAGPATIRRDGNALTFTRPLKPADWLPLWVYFHRRAALGAVLPGGAGKAAALLACLDGVMEGLAPQGPDTLMEREDGVAVDLRFHEPATGPDSVLPGGWCSTGCGAERFSAWSGPTCPTASAAPLRRSRHGSPGRGECLNSWPRRSLPISAATITAIGLSRMTGWAGLA